MAQIDFDIEFFDKVLARNPASVETLRCQAELLTERGYFDRALDLDRRLVLLRPDDAVAHYNLACSLALIGHSVAALESLRDALRHGYRDFEYLDTDGDLDSLRELPEFRKLVSEYRLRQVVSES